MSDGFKITDDDKLDTAIPVIVPNYSSSLKCHAAVDSQIREEIIHGNYVITDKPPTICSALGAIPKKNGKIRLIHDASRPEGHGLNSLVSDCSCSYMDLNDALKFITQDCYLAKVDLSSAYRSVKINPSNFQFAGLHWQFTGDHEPTFMYDTKLPFGASKSPSIFQTLTSAVCRIMKFHYGVVVIAYLDDFLIIADTKVDCTLALLQLCQTLRYLGFRINWNKVEGPAQQLTFLGVLIDTSAMTLSLPPTKVTELQNVLELFASRKRASKRQLQSLAGSLNWACQVIHNGRTFLRRVIDLQASLKQPSHKVRLTDDFHGDLNWWRQFLSVFNGTRRILDKRPVMSMTTDACLTGGGGVFSGDYFYVNWDLDMPSVSCWHINYKEVMAIMWAVFRWAPLLRDKRLVIYTDNITAKAVLNKGTTRFAQLMPFLRALNFLGGIYNFKLTARYIPGHHNYVADACSRLHERGQFQRLYQYLMLEQLDLCELLTHMSSRFFYFRWPGKPPDAVE